jgi:hypothetical protein
MTRTTGRSAGRCSSPGTSRILDMIALCRKVGLPAPGFRQEDGEFVQTLWRPGPAEASNEGTGQVTGQVTGQDTVGTPAGERGGMAK